MSDMEGEDQRSAESQLAVALYCWIWFDEALCEGLFEPCWLKMLLFGLDRGITAGSSEGE